jgi:hypothetical protein
VVEFCRRRTLGDSLRGSLLAAVSGILPKEVMEMLTARDRTRIEEIAKRYDVDRVLLFGSSAADEGEARDIDLAVEGLAPSRFFSFYGELIFASSPEFVGEFGTDSNEKLGFFGVLQGLGSQGM